MVAGGYGAIIVAGGAARRFGGVDKAVLPVGGVPMIQRVLAAVSDATVTVVVGPRRTGVPPDVIVVREQPPGGGPVAGLAAALEAAEWPPTVALLAGDLPLFTRDALGDLAAALDNHDGAVFTDSDGREQWLCGLWRTASLQRRIAALPETADQALRGLLRPMDVVRIGSAADPPPWFDCDTEDDLRRAEEFRAR
jgi:molybdopterin-guanine dinucleotide biosynthesis protein A